MGGGFIGVPRVVQPAFQGRDGLVQVGDLLLQSGTLCAGVHRIGEIAQVQFGCLERKGNGGTALRAVILRRFRHDSLEPGQRDHQVRVHPGPTRDGGGEVECDLPPRRDTVLGADFADGGDQSAGALEALFGVVVAQRGVDPRPITDAQQWDCRAACVRHRRDAGATGFVELFEDRLGDEGQHGVREAQDGVQRGAENLALRGIALYGRLDAFQVPVAEVAPVQVVERLGVAGELVIAQRGLGVGDGCGEA